MQTKCERCDCEFSFNYGDIDFKWNNARYEDTHVVCPLCGRHINMPDTYKEIRGMYEQK